MSEEHRIPGAWRHCRLGDLVAVLRGVSYSKEQSSTQPRPSSIPILRATNISQRLDFDDLVYVDADCVSDTQLLQDGDIIIAASSGSKSVVGKAAHFPGGWTGSFGAFCMGLRPLPDVESRFVAYFLQTDEYRHRVSELSSGSNINNLKRDHIQSFPFRLAPLNEQRRIVAKIEELFSDLDAGVEALTRAKANLKRYRASVLKAAVEGRLTAAWRAEHPKTEPASALLARILTERRQKWEADQLAKFTAAGKSAPKNWKDKYPEPAAPDTTDLPDLPPGWCWASVDQVASQDDYSLAIGPFGSNLKVSDYAQNGVPLVFVRNIRSGKFSDEGCKFVSPEKAIELDAHSVEGGDVLITKMGDPPGDACLYPRNLPKAIITADCIKVRLHQSLPFPGYFVDAINSAVVQSQIQGITKGVAQQKVSLGRFSTVALPLPPVTEQEELVSAISDAFSQINAAETQIEHGLLRAARLRQSILKQAFEGKLVPQDPADEPASVLLARLQPTEADKRGAGSQTSPRRAKIRK